MLVAVEGNSGAGKSTLCNNIKKMYNENIVYISENNSTDVIKKRMFQLRDDGKLKDPLLYCYLQMMDLAIRYTHFLPYIADRKIVFFDRYIDTVIARNSVRGIDISISEQIMNCFKEPEITILLSVPPEISLERINKRKKMANEMWTIGMKENYPNKEFDETKFLDNLGKMDLYFKKIKRKHFYIVDGMASESEVSKTVYNILEEHFHGNENIGNKSRKQ